MKKSLFVSLLSLSIAFALQAQTEPEKTPLTGKSPAAGAKKTPANPQPVQTSGTKSAEAGTKPADDTNAKPIDSSNMDPSVKPADDFFLYANGGWIKRTEIPPEYSRWGSFNQLIEHNNDALHAIAEKAAKAKSNEADAKKVGDYYASGMDEKTIEAMRTKPLQDELAKIDSMKDRPVRTIRTARARLRKRPKADSACLTAIITRRTTMLRRNCATNTSRTSPKC